MNNLFLKQCDGSPVDLLEVFDEKKSDFLDFFYLQSSWLPAVLDSINNKLDILEILSPSTGTLVDCGAHCGLFSLFSYPFCQQIIAIEPTKKHFDFLHFLSNKYKKLIPILAAVGPNSGQQKFYEDRVNNTQNSLVPHVNSFSCSYNVTVLTLKDILIQNNVDKVDVLKIDIEGGEIPLITNNSFDFVKDKVRKMYIEVHNIELGSFCNPLEKNQSIITDRLSDLKFKSKIVGDVILAINERSL